MNPNLQNILNGIDNFGFSEDFGMASPQDIARMQAKGISQLPAGLSKTNYTINPAIQQITQGKSTFQLTIKCDVTGTGSGNDFNPVFLFGGDAYTNTSRGYSAVQVTNPVQQTAAGFTNNKNVITFKYAATVDNYSTYTVSLSTDGEYPFILSSLSGKKSFMLEAFQMTLSDAADVAQLNNSIQTFELDEFGKSTSNDLTTPKDLYQQQTNGLWITNPVEVSGRKGIKLNVNETNNLQLNLFCYVGKSSSGCGC
jgi:hypothetical protein